MRHLSTPAMAGALALAGFAAGSAPPAQAQDSFTPQTFTYAAFITPDIGQAWAVQSFFAGVEERTGGAITFEPFWNASLCGALDALECVVSGQADIVYGSAIFNPAELPRTTIASVPFQTTNGQASTNTMMDLYAEHPPMRAEWEQAGAHVLWFAHAGAPLLGMLAPVEATEDVRGRAIRTVGYVVSPMAALGANPVATAPAEIYQAMQRGVVQGAIYTSDGFTDARLYEVVDYLYDIAEYMGVYGMLYNAINLSTWNAMSPELQAIFSEEAARVAASFQSAYMEPFDAQACEVLIDNLSEMARFGDEATSAAWATDMREASAAEWMAAMERAGVDEAEMLLADFRERVAAHEAIETGHRTGGEICIELWNAR